jgi:RHS repeat-associated protein
MKRVYSWSGSDWTLETKSRYVYDQWNEVATLDGNDTVSTTMYWGIDLSGSEQGAGGVGGLLAVSRPLPLDTGLGEGDGSFLPSFDGNGNITAYTDSTDAVVYSCFYTPFGKVIDETGTKPCPYGFSTKPLDPETGLVYYIFRDYSPELGRWISRDPIEEEGGWNLYLLSQNNALSRWEYLGKYWGDIYFDGPGRDGIIGKGKTPLGIDNWLNGEGDYGVFTARINFGAICDKIDFPCYKGLAFFTVTVTEYYYNTNTPYGYHGKL